MTFNIEIKKLEVGSTVVYTDINSCSVWLMGTRAGRLKDEAEEVHRRGPKNLYRSCKGLSMLSSGVSQKFPGKV